MFRPSEIPNKEIGLKDYRFSFCVENDTYDTYFTEKILDCFATGTIPVYLGAPDIGNHFNMDGIIILSEEFDVSEFGLETPTVALPLLYKIIEARLDEIFRLIALEVAKAKSRTLSALNTHVFRAFSCPFSRAMASSCVQIMTGSVLVFALL